MLKISSDMNKHFKKFHSSPEAIMTFVYMRLRYSLSYRDLEEMTGMRAEISIDHETLQRWVYRLSKLIENQVRKKKRPVNGSWRMDETYVKVSGKWVYLYRAVDSEGQTIDFFLKSKERYEIRCSIFKKSYKE